MKFLSRSPHSGKAFDLTACGTGEGDGASGVAARLSEMAHSSLS